MDWGIGRYERTAAQLLPAARVLVGRASPRPGERVIDVGCGTGSAALLAAERGAQVIGVDPAPRLLDVARAEAAERGLEAAFAAGDAAALPLEDGAADLVMSNFGVIFAPDAAAAGAELVRVLRPGGRIALTAWIPGGTVSQAVRIARESAPPPPGAGTGGPPFAWHERDALAGVLGLDVELSEHEISFTGESPEEYLEGEVTSHPMWVAAGDAVGAVRAKILDVLVQGNEDPAAFSTTSRYVVATATRA